MIGRGGMIGGGRGGGGRGGGGRGGRGGIGAQITTRGGLNAVHPSTLQIRSRGQLRSLRNPGQFVTFRGRPDLQVHIHGRRIHQVPGPNQRRRLGDQRSLSPTTKRILFPRRGGGRGGRGGGGGGGRGGGGRGGGRGGGVLI